MKNAFVETSNVKRFLSALSALEERGAQEACLVVVDGAPGLVKTITLKHWVSQNGCIYLRAKKEWTPSWFMNELLETLRVHPSHSFQKKYAKVLEELAVRQNTAMMERRSFSLVIDEADHVSSKSAILETIRDISDMIELPTILVGMGRVNDNLARFPQVASRVSQKVRFDKATKDDVRLLIKQRCEVQVADCLVDFVLTVSQGFNRKVLEAIANIKRFGLRSEPGDEGVTMADMAGMVLVNDRRSNQPIQSAGGVLMSEKLDVGAIPTMILHHLASGACRTIDELANTLPLSRGQISDGARALVFRNHLERIETGCYQLTAIGVAAAASGEVIKAGPWRPDTGKVRKRWPDTFRQRLWNAMHMSVTFTIGDIVIAAKRDDRDPEDNAARYIRNLKSAGYIAELPTRQKGTRLTSNGFKRFRLIKDTGPLAPVYRPRTKAVHDYNSKEDVPCDKNS